MSLSTEIFHKLKNWLIKSNYLSQDHQDAEDWNGDIRYAYHKAAQDADPRLPAPHLAVGHDPAEPTHESGIPQAIQDAIGITAEQPPQVAEPEPVQVKAVRFTGPVLFEVSADFNPKTDTTETNDGASEDHKEPETVQNEGGDTDKRERGKEILDLGDGDLEGTKANNDPADSPKQSEEEHKSE